MGSLSPVTAPQAHRKCLMLFTASSLQLLLPSAPPPFSLAVLTLHSSRCTTGTSRWSLMFCLSPHIFVGLFSLLPSVYSEHLATVCLLRPQNIPFFRSPLKTMQYHSSNMCLLPTSDFFFFFFAGIKPLVITYLYGSLNCGSHCWLVSENPSDGMLFAREE